MAQTQASDINLNALLQQVAREKDVDIDRWVSALEDAMASAAKKQHRIKEPVKAHLDRETGAFEAFIVKQVVEEVEDPLAEWTVEEARDHKEDAELGDEIRIPISTEGLGRIAAQSAKQVLYQRIREAERENVYNEYIGRVGEIVNGTVKRFERGDIVVDLGRTEAAVPRREQSRHERYSQGERIRGVIVDVHTQPKGPQIIISRTDPRLLVKLFEMEVPEIYDGTVVIKNAVRAPGERAKVAVASRERDVDPVGACVGMKGSRVQSIIRELRGEKIDIIEHSDDLVTFAQSALAPAKITRVSVTHHGEKPHLDVIVEDEQLSLAIGKRGQNVRLAAELLGARIDIKSESDVKDEVADALARMLQSAMSPGDEGEEEPIDFTLAPEIDEDAAKALGEAGFTYVEQVRDAEIETLVEVTGLSAADATSFQAWATEQAAAREAGAPGGMFPGGDEGTQGAPGTSSMSDQDFMAALSRAFAESEAERDEGDEAEQAEDEQADEASEAAAEQVEAEEAETEAEEDDSDDETPDAADDGAHDGDDDSATDDTATDDDAADDGTTDDDETEDDETQG